MADPSRAWRAALVLLLTSLVAACGMRTLKRDLEKTGGLAGVDGQVAISGGGTSPIVVVARSVADGRIIDSFVLARPGPFFFALPAGTYQVAAFEDRNRDLSYQPGEPAVLAPGDLVLQPGERRRGLDLTIISDGGVRLPFEVSGASHAQRQLDQLPALQLGTVVSIDDPRFSAENGKLGLWNPVQFLFDVGAGIYFLEEYDPKKIPVLFVHGATGHPDEWRYLISQLDRNRFQPWLAYYPTAPPLDQLGRQLLRTLSALQVKYGFSRLMLVAHSMGGLVTRSALNYAAQNAGAGRLVRVPAFVSISSPWNGHWGAAKGVKHAPVVAPSWNDMAPDSAFLTKLPGTPLLPECEYSLLFSYRGGGAFGGESNDGSVAVSSELSLPIQRQAARVMGFNETHTSILRSADVAAQLNTILTRASQ